MNTQDAAELTRPVPHAAAASLPPAWHRSRRWLRARVLGICVLLLAAPVAAYWPTVFHYYGMRDDYSKLREAHEEPGKVVHFCASNARPVYGWLLQETFERIETVRQMQWLRLAGVLLLGGLSVAAYRGLRWIGWPDGMSQMFALWAALLPAAQIIAAWTITWPYAVAALMGYAAYFVVEDAMHPGRRTGFALARLAVGAVLLAGSALVYQSNAFFYLVPLAAALIARRQYSARQTLRWVLRHLLLVVGSLAGAYFAMKGCYAAGVFEKSPRIAFERNPGEKFAWYLAGPLPNSLSLFSLNDDNRHGRAAYLAGAAAAGLLLAAGAAVEWRRHGWRRGAIWMAGLAGFPLLAFSVSMIAAERYATYRTTFAMTAVLLCFVLASAELLTRRLDRRLRMLGSACALGAAFLVARHQAFALLAEPQGHEWRLVLDGAARVRLGSGVPRVYVITPTPEDRSTDRICHDEFGSLSSNSDWVPKEMFKRAMHDLHPDVRDVWERYRFDSGDSPPQAGRYDVVVDLRDLREFRPGRLGARDQLQGDLVRLVGLGQHRGAGLHEDIPPGEVRCLLGDVDVGNVADGRLQVGLSGRQQRGGKIEPALLRAVLGPHGGDILDRPRDIRDREIGERGGRGDRRDPAGGPRAGDREGTDAGPAQAHVGEGDGAARERDVRLG